METALGHATLKDWLGYELERNKRHGELYAALLRKALAKMEPGVRVDVLIGHHVTFELDGDLTTENEIPSADCLLFDHTIMRAVFGERAVPIMVELAQLDCGERDARVACYLHALGGE